MINVGKGLDVRGGLCHRKRLNNKRCPVMVESMRKMTPLGTVSSLFLRGRTWLIVEAEGTGATDHRQSVVQDRAEP